MKSLLTKVTSDVFTLVGFGVDLKGLDMMLEDNPKNEHPFIEAAAAYSPLFQARAQSPTWLWKLKRLLNIGDEEELRCDSLSCA